MFEQAFKNIDDVLRKEAGCTTELDYTEQTSWLLFLKYLDGLEEDRTTEAALAGKKYTLILEKPYRWESWAAPKDKDGTLDHNKALTGDDLCDLSTPGWNCLKTSSLKLSVFSLSWGAFFGSTRAASILPSRPPNLGAAARRACQGWPRLRGRRDRCSSVSGRQARDR